MMKAESPAMRHLIRIRAFQPLAITEKGATKTSTRLMMNIEWAHPRPPSASTQRSRVSSGIELADSHGLPCTTPPTARFAEGEEPAYREGQTGSNSGLIARIKKRRIFGLI